MKKLILILMTVLVGVLMAACAEEASVKELVKNVYYSEVQDNQLVVARFYEDGRIEREEDGTGLFWEVEDIIEVATKTLESSEVKENEGIEYVYILSSRRETAEEIDKYGKKTEYYIYGDIHTAKFDIEELKKVVDPSKASIEFEKGVFITDSRAEPNKEIANKALSRFVGLSEIVSEDYLTDLEIADILENSLNKGIQVLLIADSPFEKEEDSILSKLLSDSVISLRDLYMIDPIDGFNEEKIEATEKVIERLRENKNQSLPY